MIELMIHCTLVTHSRTGVKRREVIMLHVGQIQHVDEHCRRPVQRRAAAVNKVRYVHNTLTL